MAETDTLKIHIEGIQLHIPLNFFQKSRKRRLDDVEDEDEDERPAKYHAGGGGIHRPIAVAKRGARGKTGAEYKAKVTASNLHIYMYYINCALLVGLLKICIL
jgi:hypothetical protein